MYILKGEYEKKHAFSLYYQADPHRSDGEIGVG